MARKNYTTKDCPGCDVVFVVLDPRQKYCTRKCARAHQPRLAHSEESKAKIRMTNKETWAKIFPYEGRRARNERQDVIRKRPYRLWRTAVFERDDYTCQGCYQRGGELHADHIKQWALYPELRFEVSNGRTLCKECHAAVTLLQRKVVFSCL